MDRTEKLREALAGLAKIETCAKCPHRKRCPLTEPTTIGETLPLMLCKREIDQILHILKEHGMVLKTQHISDVSSLYFEELDLKEKE